MGGVNWLFLAFDLEKSVDVPKVKVITGIQTSIRKVILAKKKKKKKNFYEQWKGSI